MCRQTKSACVLSVLVLLGLGAVDTAHGAAILLSDGREISAFATASTVNEDGELVDDTDSGQSNPSPFAPWTDEVGANASLGLGLTSDAGASQSSSVTPTVFTADMFSAVATTVNVGSATGLATSVFHVSFELTTPHSFELTGFASAFPPVGGRRGASVFLGFGSHRFPDSDPLNATGVLDPGVYNFFARTAASVIEDIGPGEFFADAALVFEFALTDLAPVPEPTAWLLLGAAVAGAAWSGRRKVRSGAA